MPAPHSHAGLFEPSSIRPVVGEDFDGRAGHEDLVGRLIPADFEIAAGEVGKPVTVRPVGEHTGDADGADSVGASDLLTLFANWGPCP